MQERFEKNIEQKLNEFNIEPSPQIWQEVETALHEKRKRRVVAWWWTGLCGLVLLGGGIFIATNQLNKSDNQITKENEVHKPVQQQVLQENNSLQNKELKDEVINEESTVIHQSIIQKEKTNTVVVTKSINNNKAEKDKSTDVFIIDLKIGLKENKNITTIEADKNIVVEKENVQSSVTGTKGISDSTEIVVTNADSAVKKDSAIAKTKTDSSNNTTKKEEKKKKHQWLLTAGGGLSYVNGNGFLTGGNSYGSLLYNNAPQVGSGARTPSTVSLPQPGYFLLLGATYEQTFNKRWKGYAGLQYRYINNKQVADSSYTTVTNYSHWLQLPVSIGYTFNPSSKNKFQFLLGGSVAWAFAEKWLVTDQLTGSYYYNSSLNNHFIFNIHTGLQYNVENKWMIAFMLEQSLTPIHNQISNKYYWQQLSLQASIPFSLFNKQKTK
jgi:hypothetical protein